MDLNKNHFKSHAQGETEALESRVSSLSISDRVDSSFHPDCQRFEKDREGNESKPISGFMSQPIARIEGYEPELSQQAQHSREEIALTRDLMNQQAIATKECNIIPESSGFGSDESGIFEDQEIYKTEDCMPMLPQHDESGIFEDQEIYKTEDCMPMLPQHDEGGIFEDQEIYKTEDCMPMLPQHARVEDNKNRDFMISLMAKTKDCDTYLSEQSTVVENDESSCIIGQKMANSEECDAKLPQCTHEENDENKGFMSQVMQQQVARSEECVPKARQYTRNNNNEKIGFVGQQMAKAEDCDINLPQFSDDNSDRRVEPNTCHQKRGKYFYYDPPLSEETGVWIPVSVPPMSESEHEEWTKGFCSNGGSFPEEDMGWGDLSVEDKELTMWDVVVEMLLVARGKVNAFASGDIPNISWISSHIIDQAWKEMAQTLTEANYSKTQEILEAEPPKWLPDSAASACMLCNVRFHPIMCSRHHCRFCGGIFCSECTKGRSLLPERFRFMDPQRVCDVCCVRLESVQPWLMDQVSRAAQLPTHDLTDLSTLRSWLNFPWGQSMEYEIYKATNTIRGYNQVGSLRPEKSIPDAILRHAKGLAILTVMKVGVVVTYNIGTGLVVARREDGSWSPPSAISSFGVGWGAQAGGEFTDFIIVLRSNDAVKTFSGDVHLSVGAGLSAAVGIVGRTAEADVRAGTGGYAACYTYSCSKGAFVGCSLEGSVVTTRVKENSRFYGSQSLTASDILLGSLPKPPAAATLYRALADLYQKLDV